MHDTVWYAAYGSNLAPDRFACYLEGGRPLGGDRTYPGARDRTPARESRPLELPGAVRFAWESRTWAGAVAFYDPDADGRALAAAYRIRVGQLSDLVSQEMHRPPGDDLDLTPLWQSRSHELGSGRYERLLVVDEIGAEPVVTFTHPVTAAPTTNAPSAAYLATIARGLARHHGLDAHAVVDYLISLDGMRPAWERPDLVRVVTVALGRVD